MDHLKVRAGDRPTKRSGEWYRLRRAQMPPWDDTVALQNVLELVRTLPPLVSWEEISDLAVRLAEICQGDGFLVQGGDCAETFADDTDEHVFGTTSTLLEMADIIGREWDTPVTVIGRFAGQYAKPRTSSIDPDGLPVYRGDMINSTEVTPAARVADPLRIILSYFHSREVLGRVAKYLRKERADLTGEVPVYSSHEALVLEYEDALVRQGTVPYAGSAHFLWIGDRTRQLNGAHVNLLANLANPIGIKLGPTSTPEDVVALCRRINPENLPGRLSLTTRLGHNKIRKLLPPVIDAVMAAGQKVIWQCDPMHGNTTRLHHGYRTRPFSWVIEETRQFFEIHRRSGSRPGGLHVELTGDNVTECSGGAAGISDDDVPKRFLSAVDPRLNREQALELAMLIAELR